MEKLKRKNLILFYIAILLSLIISIFIICIVKWNMSKIEYISLDEYEDGTGIIWYNVDYIGICEDNINFDVFESNINNQYLIMKGNGNFENCIDIKGWCMKRGESIDTYNINICLKPKESEDARLIKLRTEPVIRQDITNYFNNDGRDYNYAGFFSSVSKSKLDKNTLYEVFILFQCNNNHYIIQTDKDLFIN